MKEILDYTGLIMAFVALCLVVYNEIKGLVGDTAPNGITDFKYTAPLPPSPVPQYYAFNLNDIIKVQLTDAGYQRMADYYNEIPINGFRSADYYSSRADSEGYTTFQAWDFVATFGAVTSSGSNHWATTVLIKAKDLSPVPDANFESAKTVPKKGH